MMNDEEFWAQYHEDKEFSQNYDDDARWHDHLRSLRLKAFDKACVAKEVKDLRRTFSGKSGKKVKFLWITVSPPPGSFLIFKKKWEKVLTKKWFQGGIYTYAYEQRKPSSYYEGSNVSLRNCGFHVHCALKPQGSFSKAHAIREIFSTMKDVLKTSSCIDVKSLPEVSKSGDQIYQDKLQYFVEKYGEGKAEKQTGDKKFREIFSLLPIYQQC